MKIIVQKFGGATLSTPEKINDLAEQVARLRQQSKSLIIVVSAMGGTTNELIGLARRISHTPHRRELDMLLTAGERISMSLMSMALNHLGCPAISFTGSQAGLLTDQNHSNAMITDLKPYRVQEALQKGQVVVLAGFQGVSPLTKEVTTLGRGGSDTTAVALASHFKAKSCEILKEVEGVYSADPNQIPEAQLLSHLSYDQLTEMTFWGAKVLHSRAAELAGLKSVPLLIKAAHSPQFAGTHIGASMEYEGLQILSLNSLDDVLCFEVKADDSSAAIEGLLGFFKQHNLSDPQILSVHHLSDHKLRIYLTAAKEGLEAIRELAPQAPKMALLKVRLSTVTLTCSGATNPRLIAMLTQALSKAQIPIRDLFLSGMSLTLFIDASLRKPCLETLHPLSLQTVDQI